MWKLKQEVDWFDVLTVALFAIIAVTNLIMVFQN